ncbi:MFS transporter [Acetobacterium woodii]|uniref:Macrolide-efflux protein, major facilitator superfamily MFS-1 n=1 Tax=Acetobacterium woodii (strain ATCC 29683 / DSM 1030 / JCM 2381 / KCTC 1655 / WB1) TaxID=931626 RepID=H6LK74_ACEWD|nr:MFS transporter [Acetobacterium woodii]AFA49994.1 macrolide-efflux protein, major facilitator superfamily MFS-1 [Acetobacterium woodii DSM 1030]
MKRKKRIKNPVKEKIAMKKFMILVAGEFISSIGSGLTDFGLTIYILTLTRSVGATGVFAICAFLPSILLAPVGGVLADRYDRRLMMILGELLSGLALLISLVSVMSLNPSLGVICFSVALSSVFSALTEPAFKATITDLLTEKDFARGSGMVQLATSAKLLIAPAMAGLLLQVTAVSTLIILDMLTFFTTVLIIAFVRKGMMTKPLKDQGLRIGQEMAAGMKVILAKKGIMILIMIMTITTFCLGFVQILSKPLILAIAGETELGIITTVIAIGMMVGSIVVSTIKQPKSYVRMLSVGLFGCGIFFALIGISKNLFLIAGFGFMMFVFMPAIQIAAEVMIRTNLENAVQGRAFGLIGLITQMGYILAFAAAGVLSDAIFEPFMQGNSELAMQIGGMIGCGVGRGNALLIMLTGIGLAVVGIIAASLKAVKNLDKKEVVHETVTGSCPEGF